MEWPVFTLLTGQPVAINPALTSAVYKSREGHTEIYTLDCTKDDDAWDVKESFEHVVTELSVVALNNAMKGTDNADA